MGENWPERPILRSPFNHNKKCAIAEPHLQPDTSPVVIQQIANAMGSKEQEPINHENKCSQMLSTMPDIPDMDPPSPATPAYGEQAQNSELAGLLRGGHRPIDKIDGKWTETSEGSGKLIIE